MNKKIEDKATLKKIAIVISEYPRYTMKEIAESVGISKATIHRVYGSRENLIAILTEMSEGAIAHIVEIINADFAHIEEHLKAIIQAHFDNRELIQFSGAYQICESGNYTELYINSLDSFFEKGQEKGIFGMGIPNTTMTEAFISLFCGLSDSRKRHCIEPNKQVEIFMTLFYSGIRENTGN